MMDRSRWGIFLPKGEAQKNKKGGKEKETRRASKKVPLALGCFYGMNQYDFIRERERRHCLARDFLVLGRRSISISCISG